MAIAATQAAIAMEEAGNELSPHAVIQLLLDGAVERLDEAAKHLQAGDEDQAGRLMEKAINILNGLRSSLDFDQGGETAVRLEKLYCHIIRRLMVAESDTGPLILAESSKLLNNLKTSWDAIA